MHKNPRFLRGPYRRLRAAEGHIGHIQGPGGTRVEPQRTALGETESPPPPVRTRPVDTHCASEPSGWHGLPWCPRHTVPSAPPRSLLDGGCPPEPGCSPRDLPPHLLADIPQAAPGAGRGGARGQWAGFSASKVLRSRERDGRPRTSQSPGSSFCRMSLCHPVTSLPPFHGSSPPSYWYWYWYYYYYYYLHCASFSILYFQPFCCT